MANSEIIAPKAVIFLRSLMSRSWYLKLFVLTVVFATTATWLIVTLALSIPFILPIWYVWWIHDRPILYALISTTWACNALGDVFFRIMVQT